MKLVLVFFFLTILLSVCQGNFNNSHTSNDTSINSVPLDRSRIITPVLIPAAIRGVSSVADAFRDTIKNTISLSKPQSNISPPSTAGPAKNDDKDYKITIKVPERLKPLVSVIDKFMDSVSSSSSSSSSSSTSSSSSPSGSKQKPSGNYNHFNYILFPTL